MRILLADDHAMVRSGLGLLLTRLFGDVQIVEAGDYPRALQLCREDGGIALILIDRVMPGNDNGDGLRELCRQADGVPVVVLSASDHPAHVTESIASGARGYLPKTTNEGVFFSALQLVLAGGLYLPTSLLPHVDHVRSAVSTRRTAANTALTPRQRQILERVALGKTNKDIAREFNLSPTTVQAHLNAIFRALSATNRTQAVHMAQEMGLL